jgi:hypothetical protein
MMTILLMSATWFIEKVLTIGTNQDSTERVLVVLQWLVDTSHRCIDDETQAAAAGYTAILSVIVLLPSTTRSSKGFLTVESSYCYAGSTHSLGVTFNHPPHDTTPHTWGIA